MRPPAPMRVTRIVFTATAFPYSYIKRECDFKMD
jgi:hypothetical protein